MKRITVRICIAILMFIVGLAFSWLYPTFTMIGNIPCDNSRCVYWFHSTLSSNFQAITLANDYTSAEESQRLFESNLISGEIIERKEILSLQGQKIGEKAIVKSFSSKGKNEIRILWTDKSEIWLIAAPSLRLAHQFEESDSFQNAIRINKITKLTAK